MTAPLSFEKEKLYEFFLMAMLGVMCFLFLCHAYYHYRMLLLPVDLAIMVAVAYTLAKVKRTLKERTIMEHISSASRTVTSVQLVLLFVSVWMYTPGVKFAILDCFINIALAFALVSLPVLPKSLGKNVYARTLHGFHAMIIGTIGFATFGFRWYNIFPVACVVAALAVTSTRAIPHLLFDIEEDHGMSYLFKSAIGIDLVFGLPLLFFSFLFGHRRDARSTLGFALNILGLVGGFYIFKKRSPKGDNEEDPDGDRAVEDGGVQMAPAAEWHDAPAGSYPEYPQGPSPYPQGPSPYAQEPGPYAQEPSPYAQEPSPYPQGPSPYPQAQGPGPYPQVAGLYQEYQQGPSMYAEWGPNPSPSQEYTADPWAPPPGGFQNPWSQ